MNASDMLGVAFGLGSLVLIAGMWLEIWQERHRRN